MSPVPLPLLPTLGVPELLIIAVLVVVLFGTGKLPEVARSMGKGLRQFRKAQREVDAVLEPDLDALLDEPAQAEKAEDAVEVTPEERG